MGLKFNPLSGQFDTVVDNADEINYDNTTSGLTATDAQAAIDEVEGRLDTTETSLSGHLDGGANKHDATEIDYERADGSKKNIQASSDNLEASTSDLDDAIGSMVQGTNYTASSIGINASHLSGIDTALGNLSTLINNFEWQESAIDYITDNTAAPPTEVSGDRYVLSHDGGAPNAAWDGASAGDIVEFNGTTWDATTPTTGMMISIDDETTSLRQWGGSSWDQKFFESTTASGFLSISTFDVQLTNLSDGNLIIGSAGNVATSVDTASLGDIDADTVAGLTIKAGAVANAEINASAAIEFSKMENLTISRALVSDGSGDVSVSATTSTEIGFVSGVTSSIQTQLDNKLTNTDVFSTNANSGVFNAVNFETHLIDTSGGTATVTLPSPTTDAYIVIKDEGNANTNNITINTPGAETIDGSASLIIDSDYGSVILVSDGTNWFIL